MGGHTSGHIEMTKEYYAEAISRKCKLVFLRDGEVLPMQNFVDRFGDDTDDVDEAISAIAPLPDGRWVVIDLTQFETVVRN